MRCLMLLVIALLQIQAIAGEPQAIYEGSGNGIPKQPQAWISDDNLVHLTFGVGEQVYYTRSEKDRFNSPQPAFQIPNMSPVSNHTSCGQNRAKAIFCTRD